MNFTSGNTLGLTGSNGRILFANSGGLTNAAGVTVINNGTGVIGAWAIANSDSYATYNPSLGIGAVGSAGFQGYSAAAMTGGITTVTNAGTSTLTTYSGGTLTGFVPTSGSVAGNVTNLFDGSVGLNQAIVLPSGGASTDYLRLAGSGEGDIAFTNATDVLNLYMGGLLHSNSTNGSSTIGTSAVRGVLTSGGTLSSGTTNLVVYNTANTATAGTGATNSTVINSNVLTLSSTANVFAGMVVTGTGLGAGNYVTSVVDATHVTLNYNATSTTAASGSAYSFVGNIAVNSFIQDNGLGNSTRLDKSGTGTLSLTGGITANTTAAGVTVGSAVVTIPGTFATFNGEAVSGGGLLPGTTIVSGGGTGSVTLSNNITSPAGATTLLTFGSKGASTLTATLAGSTAVTGLSSTSGLYVGQPVSGPGIAAGTMVAAVTGSSTITLSTAATSTGSQSLTFGTGSTSAPSYSGGTVIDQGTVNLSGPGVGTVVIPAGGLTLVGTQAGITATTLNVGVSSFNGNIVGIGGQIDPSNDVTMIGKTILNLAGINTLHSLTFTNNGGDGAPTVNVAPTGTVPVSILNLSSASPITASIGTNPSQVSLLSAGTVGLAPGEGLRHCDGEFQAMLVGARHRFQGGDPRV